VKDREKEYREIFIAESLQEYDDLSRHIVELEKRPGDDKLLGEIFRLLHNLKANSKAIGCLNVAEIAHRLESVFSLIRNRELEFNGEVVTVLFDGIDYLGLLLGNIDSPDYRVPDEELIRNLDAVADKERSNADGKSPLRKIYTSQNVSLSDLIYIQVKKLDDLLNLVGELIIDRDRILALAREVDSPELKTVSAHLERVTNELQFSVMDARLVNIGSLFNKFPRVVRDVALMENKQVNLTISGQDIQIDRNILQLITDALLHIIRNAVTHGIEEPVEREQNGKSREGRLSISALPDKDMVVIEVADDGHGIDAEEVRRHAVKERFVAADKILEMRDEEVFSFLFEPGFSLSKRLTELSGRGVGLDVVKNALDTVGGKIHISSVKGKGTTFTLYLPTSIAVKGALLFEVKGNSYAIPLIHTQSVSTILNEDLHHVGGSVFFDFKGETIPVVYLEDIFIREGVIEDAPMAPRNSKAKQDMVIVTYNNRRLGLIVDKLLRQQDIVVKPLQKPVHNIDLFGGVTLLGTGEVCLVLDVPSISKCYLTRRNNVDESNYSKLTEYGVGT
jgi:two-component system, chemotaxis family, sensor kinase CheA